MTMKLLTYLYLGLLVPFLAHAQPVPLPNAHAHNDYEHSRPLLDALDHGFTSVEADIHLINGQLYVSHGPPDPAKARTLKELYLEPLRQRVNQHGGWVYVNYPQPLLLLVDSKTEAETTYQVLRKQLQEYATLLIKHENGKMVNGAVLIVLSGNRPMNSVSEDPNRLVTLDGRPADLDSGYSSAVMPLISTNFRQLVSWNGEGKLPEAELAKVRDLAAKVHAQGKKLRLWATPESEAVWAALLAAGVDYLNTDQLDRLRQFLRR